MTPDFLNLGVYTVGNYQKDFPVQTLCPYYCPTMSYFDIFKPVT